MASINISSRFIRKLGPRIVGSILIIYSCFIFPAVNSLVFAQDIIILSPTPETILTPSSTPKSSLLEESTPVPPADLTPQATPSSILETPSDSLSSPSSELLTNTPPEQKESLIDKLSNILLKKITHVTKTKTRFGKLEKDNFAVNDPITLTNSSIDPKTRLTIIIESQAGESQSLDSYHISDVDGESIVVDPPRSLKPGKYTLTITDNAGETFTDEFYWGVLTLNTNKATYKPDEKAIIAIAVLDEKGEMVCDADVTLSITTPKGTIDTLSTGNGSIRVNEVCSKKDFTLIPDYETDYTVHDSGIYSFELTAETKNGIYDVTDSIEVAENMPFEVERTSATRLYPVLTYPMYISVTANQDFTGTITDVVPEEFDITKRDDAIPYDRTKKAHEIDEQGQVLGASTNDLIQPFDGHYPISLKFGELYGLKDLIETILNKNDLAGHDGIDIEMPMNTPIYSTDTGTVSFAGDGEYGKTIIIDHEWGQSYYGHLNSIKVSVGDKINKRDQIAESGDTGISTGPHLHFGIKSKNTDVNNGYKGMEDPLTYVEFEQQGAVLGSTTSVKNYPTRQIQWDVTMKKGQTIKLGYTFNTPIESPELYKIGKLTIVEKDISNEQDQVIQTNINENNSFEKIRTSPEFQEELQKAQKKAEVQDLAQESKSDKKLTEKVLFTERRFWQLAIDTVILTGGITEAETQFGGLQRKIAYVNSNWYAFDNDGGTVRFSKSSDGITWNSPVTVSDGDTDNFNPTISVSNSIIHAFWLDDGAENIEGRRINTASADAQGTLCSGMTSQGSIGSSFTVALAKLDDASVILGYSDTSSDTEVDLFKVTGLSGACTVTDIQTGNMTFGSGIIAGGRPVLIPVSATAVDLVFQDGNLSYSRLNTQTAQNDWLINNATIASVTDSVYSAVSDGTTTWILTVSSAGTGTNFYSCCTADFAETSLDADAGGNGDDQWSDLDIFCVSATDCKVVYTDNIDSAGSQDLNFIDCDNAACTGSTPTTLDADINGATNGVSIPANPEIFCSGADDCKIVALDNVNSASPDIVFYDCDNADSADCSSGLSTVITDTDFGGASSYSYFGLDCPSSTNCKFTYYTDDANGAIVADSIVFVDCADDNCANTTDTLTGIAVVGNSTYGPYLSTDCVASTNCKTVAQDYTNGDLILVDCSTAGNTETCGTPPAADILDNDIGITASSVPVAIDCIADHTDCKIAYGDGTDIDLTFIDCSNADCTTTNSVTDLDTNGSDATTLYISLDMDCVSATDCKITYVGDGTSGSEKVYFIDCDNAGCTTGSAIQLPGPRLRSAVDCPATNDCKIVYYEGTTGSQPSVQFADCDVTNCFPSVTDATDPWSSQTNVTSVTLSYDSSNTDLYASVIKDTSEQAYFKSTDASSISWSTETSYAFTAGDLGNISSPLQGAGTTQIGISIRQGSNYEFKFSQDVISISGTCTQYNRSTACSDDGSNAISVAVGGTLQAQTDANVDGSWEITGVSKPGIDAIITIFINGESTASERANAVTKYDNTGNITGVVLYQRHLTIGSDDAQTITNANISSYDYSVSSSDADIFFEVDANDDLKLDPATTPLYTDEVLYPLPNNPYQPGAAGSSNVTTHHLEIPASATLTANANTINVYGSWTNNGTYTCSSNTVNLRSTGTSDTIKSSSNAFCNLRINNDLKAYHKLDEGTGVTANDASGEGLTGTVSSTPTWTTAKDSTYYGANPGAVTLASSRYIGMGDVSPVNFDSSDPISVSAWIKTTSDSGMTIASKQFQAGSNYTGWMVQTGIGGYVFWQLISVVSSNHLEVRTTNDMNYYDGNWHHVVTTYSGSKSPAGVKIYFDGTDITALTTTANSLTGSTTNTAPFSIGSRNNAEQFWAGDLDDIRVYKRVLSSSEVTALNSGTHPTDGTYTLSDALDVNGNLTISTGSLDQSSNNFAVTVNGNYLNTANLTTRASSLITMDASTGTKTIQSDAAFNNLTINDGGGPATFQADKQRFLSTGNVTITGGTFTPASTCNAATACGITLGGNFTNSDTFTASTGTVTFNNASTTSNLSYSANTTFNNFNVSTAGKSMVFDKDFRTIVSGTLTLAGSACTGRVNLDSESAGTQFEINATGTKSVSYVDVQDSNAITAITATTSKNSGNNTNWTIDDSPAQSDLLRHGEWFDACGEARPFTY